MALSLQLSALMSCVRRTVRNSVVVLSLGLLWSALPNVAYSDDSCTPAQSNGTDVSIALADNTNLPAGDLVCDAGCLAALQQSGAPFTMDSKQALRAQLAGVDLSQLEPNLTTDVYKGADTSADENLDSALGVQNWDWVTYQADICGSSGRYHFNVATQATGSNPSQTMTLMLSRDLHSFLLRKELLRKLGYKIPPIKYLPHVKLQFPSTGSASMVQIGTDKNGNPILERLIDRVLTKWLPDAANGAADRWCGMAKSALDVQLKTNPKYPCKPIPDADVNGDPYTIELQDVILMQATPLIYDVAIGPPITTIPGTENIRPEELRIIRALSVAYGLLNIPESVNQFDWYAARQDNGVVTTHVPDQANFATSMDDGIWMARKLAKLSREDFQEIVANSYYPDAVAKLIVEKLISRRNNIVSTFGLKDPALDFDPKISAPPTVKDGKVVQVTWYGYASDFAFGDQPSPLKGIQWYLLSEVQSNAMETLMNKVNLAIPSLNATDAYSKHGQDLIQGAIQKYLNTGVMQTASLGMWFAPLLNGSVQISRDVVFGQYLGTNQLVQLADTFGFTLQAGLLIGVDGLGATPLSVSGQIQGTVNLALTHLIPLQAMKDAETQPLEKEIVAWVFRDASMAFKEMADQQKVKTDPTATNQALAADVQKLSKYLGPGESLVLTESIAADETVSAGLAPTSMLTHHNLIPSLGPSVDMNETILSRIHFVRKDGNDSNTIVIYKDSGELIGPTLSMEFTLGSAAQFPVFSLSAKKVAGSATTKVITLNIEPDKDKNPQIFEVAGGLAAALRTGSTEVLESEMKNQVPQVTVHFSDGSSTMQFLHWMRRTLKSNGTYDVTLADGDKRTYMTLTDGKQTGASYQALGTQAASYLIQRLTNNPLYAVDTQANPNPGQTFFGHSQTRDTMLQSRLDSGQLGLPYVRVNYRWEGWDLKSQNARDLVNTLADKYGVQFYNPQFLGTTTDIKMYEVMLQMNVYEAGINQLLSTSKSDMKAFEKKYWDRNICDNYMDNVYVMSGDQEHRCATLENFESALGSYAKDTKGLAKLLKKDATATKKIEKQSNKIARDVLNAVSNLEQFADFGDFVQMLGGPGTPDGPARIYITSQITGFREGAEKTLDPINADRTYGMKDPDYPSGITDWVESTKLQIDDGEFNMKWLRTVL